VTCTYSVDDKTGRTVTLDAGERFNEMIARERGREFVIKFSNALPNDPAEIESWGVLFSQDDPRARTQ